MQDSKKSGGQGALYIVVGAVVVLGLGWAVYSRMQPPPQTAPAPPVAAPKAADIPSPPANPPAANPAPIDPPPGPEASAAPAPPAPPPIKASFDCSKAKVTAEKMICSSPGLAAMDVQLDNLFKRARARTADPATLISDHEAWLEIRNACTSTQCLREAYADREDDVRRWLAQ